MYKNMNEIQVGVWNHPKHIISGKKKWIDKPSCFPLKKCIKWHFEAFHNNSKGVNL